MDEDLKVSVVEFGDRKFYMMQWRDPMNGRKRTKSTKVERTGRSKDRREAERVAAQLEAQLRQGQQYAPLKTTWVDFRDKYEAEALSGLAEGTGDKVACAFKWVEDVLNPVRLTHLTAERLSHLQAEMRLKGLAEATIKGHLAHIKAALRWAERIELVGKGTSGRYAQASQGLQADEGQADHGGGVRQTAR